MAEENKNNNFIVILNLSKSFLSPDKKKNMILDIHKMEFAKGSKYCLKGVSGSGKTTLLNIIAGILVPDTGDILINDTIINKLKEEKRDKFRAKNIGYIFQNFNLLQGYTAIENILIAMNFANSNPSREKATMLLEKVGLKDKINYKPSELSFGQQQRVAIARTLANEPRLILADEPTGSLDKQNKEDIINLIINLANDNNSTLITASHDKEVIEKFDNIIEL